MRWKAKPKTVLFEGDQRTRKVFAFMPKKCKDGLVRWLEFVYVNETFKTDWGILRNKYIRWYVDSYEGI
jgi:hypothetical protein